MEREITFNSDNLDKHAVAEFEAEEALFDGWQRRTKNGPNYQVLGRTEEGRYLELVVRVTDDEYHIFHGRDMTPTERRRYGRK